VRTVSNKKNVFESNRYGGKAAVRIGDRSEDRFIPEVASTRFRSGRRTAVELFVRHPHAALCAAKQAARFADGVIELELSPADESASVRHRFFDLGSDDLEYEIVFAAQPRLDTVEFELEFPDGLDFHYQKALTQEEIDDGAERPPNVVGSHAVYWNQSGRIMAPGGGEIVNYETGKFGHFYRPFLKDATGRRVWCQQEIDVPGRRLLIRMPLAFLKQATYPVVLGPTFGHTSIGGTNHSSMPANRVIAAGPHSPGSNGDATHVTWYCNAAGNITQGFYSGATPGALVRDTGSTAGGGPAWQTQALDSTAAVVTGTSYWMAINTSAGNATKYDAVGGFSLYYVAQTYSAGNLPNPLSGALWVGTRKYSAYVTYTAGGPVVEDVTVQASGVVSLADLFQAVESQAISAKAVISLTDVFSGAFVEAVTVQAKGTVAVEAALSAAETLSVSGKAVIVVADNLTLREANTFAAKGVISVTDALAVAESLLVRADAVIVVTDTLVGVSGSQTTIILLQNAGAYIGGHC